MRRTGSTLTPTSSSRSRARVLHGMGYAALLLAIATGASCDTGNRDTGPSETRGSPWLSVSETKYDFGSIPHGQTREKVFLVENTGPQRVRLNGIRSQCTCATLHKRILRDGEPVDRTIHDPPILDKGSFLMLELEPGEVLELTVRVDTSLKSPLDHSEPSFSELVFEPAEAGTIRIAYEFRIRARMLILTAVDIRGAPSVKLGKYGQDQRAFGVLELAPRDGKAFEVLEIANQHERLKLTPTKPSREGGHRWLIELTPNGEAGYFQHILEFKTDLDEGYVCPVRVEGIAVPNLQILPNQRLDFGRFDFATERRRSVDFIYRRPSFDPRFRVTKVSVQADGKTDVSSAFSAAFEPLEKGEWRLSLHYQGGLQARRLEGLVEVTSADANYERVVLRFTGYHAPQKSGAPR